MPTYTDLKTDIAAYVENRSTKFQTALPRIISQGLDMLGRVLPLEIDNQEISFSLQTTTDIITFSALSGSPEPVVVDWLVHTNGDFIEKRSMAYLRMFGGATGRPKYFAYMSPGALKVAPWPSASAVVTMQYLKRQELSDSVATCWYSENTYSLLLNACLMEAQKFMIDVNLPDSYRGDFAVLLATATRDHHDMLRKVYQPPAATPQAQPKGGSA